MLPLLKQSAADQIINWCMMHQLIILNMSLLVPPAAPQLVQAWHDTTGNQKEAKKTKRTGPSDLARS
ncbi:MAG: hypothetical protein AYW82_03900 [Bifidobacterium dentium]|nr:MAG: hypothetical protein AYW82_03900 [Bifidobacterium dentium]